MAFLSLLSSVGRIRVNWNFLFEGTFTVIGQIPFGNEIDSFLIDSGLI